MNIILIVLAALVIFIVIGSLIGRFIGGRTYTRQRPLSAPGTLDNLNFQNVSPTRSWSAYGTQAQSLPRNDDELFV